MVDFEIRELTKSFYLAYPYALYPEIATKDLRPYDVAIFESTYDYFICIPFRSNIRHKQCYHFKSSVRSIANQSGLDYSKIVIVRNQSFIGKCTVVDNDEAKEFMFNAQNIHNDVLAYVETYVDHVSGRKILSPEQFKRRYQYTTLMYFHTELGLVSPI